MGFGTTEIAPVNRAEKRNAFPRAGSRALRCAGLFRAFQIVLLAAGIASVGACELIGPMPSGGIPRSQIIEGGAQIRVLKPGFDKFKGLLQSLIVDQLDKGVCLPAGRASLPLAKVDYCRTPSGSCSSGCEMSLSPDDFFIDVNGNALRFFADAKGFTSLPIIARDPLFGATIASCTLDVNIGRGQVAGAISIGTSKNGHFRFLLDDVALTRLGNVKISGCGILGGIIDSFTGVVKRLIYEEFDKFAHKILGEELDKALAKILPTPLGIHGAVNLEPVLTSLGFSPVRFTQSTLETSLVPGGFAAFEDGGVSVGIITGFNYDNDPTTRRRDLTSEPAPCAPIAAPPDFTDALANSSRGSFRIAKDEALDALGQKLNADVAVGVSEATMNLGFHHLAASGAFCLRFTQERINDLSIGSVSLFLPSLQKFSKDGSEPLLLTTRPTKPPQLEFGEGTDSSPTLQITLPDFELDMYAFISGRFVRIFTVAVDFEVAANIDFEFNEDDSPTLYPILQTIRAKKVGFLVKNDELLVEDRRKLEALLPVVLNITLPKVAEGIGGITLPSFAGFEMENLQTRRISGSNGNLLAVVATLGQSDVLENLLGEPRSGDFSLNKSPIGPQRRTPISMLAMEISVKLAKQKTRARSDSPQISQTIIATVPTHDNQGRTIEWSYRTEKGMWHEFQSGPAIQLSDPALLLQGKRSLLFRARATGDYRTLARDEIEVPYVFDTVPPKIDTAKTSLDITSTQKRAREIMISATDFVSEPEKLVFSLSHPNQTEPESQFVKKIFLGDAIGFEQKSNVRIWVRDENGNTSSEVFSLNVLGVGATGAGGCSSTGSSSPLWLFSILLAAFLTRRSRRRVSPALSARFGGLLLMTTALLATATSGCSEDSCEAVTECNIRCDDGLFPMCTAGMCACGGDIPLGNVGEFADMAITSDQTIWLSAYNSDYGDLMVAKWLAPGSLPDSAWRFVDGVPEGPISVRGGIRNGVYASGSDVGTHSSIALSIRETPIIAYVDNSGSQLRYAHLEETGWAHYPIDGTRENEAAGTYAKILLDELGRPIIAYRIDLTDMSDGKSRTTSEIRVAHALTTSPESIHDWQFERVVHKENTRIELGSGLPGGVGVGLSATITTDFQIALAYYDRETGSLMLATRDAYSSGIDRAWTIEKIDGGDGRDVGFRPAISSGKNNSVHISYQDLDRGTLQYVSTQIAPELVDSGIRARADGGEAIHLVGAESAIITTPIHPVIAYQDATSLELLLATRSRRGNWAHRVLRGAKGADTSAAAESSETSANGSVSESHQTKSAYGFYPKVAYSKGKLTIASWAIDQENQKTWVEILQTDIRRR